MRKAKAAAKVENPTPTKEELEAQQLAVLDKTIETVKEAQRKYAEFTQEQVDAISPPTMHVSNSPKWRWKKPAWA